MKAMIDALTQNRFFVTDHLISKDLAYALLDEASSSYICGEFNAAGIGRELTKKIDDSIRSDETLWWKDEPTSEAQQEYLEVMKKIMDELNPVFYLGLRSFEGHFARYAEGSFYKKHIDQHRGMGLRRLSTILYLSDFESEDGGELVLFDHNNPEVVVGRVTPKFGRLVVFLTEDFPHEVEVAHKPRLSVTGWLRAQ